MVLEDKEPAHLNVPSESAGGTHSAELLHGWKHPFTGRPEGKKVKRHCSGC